MTRSRALLLLWLAAAMLGAGALALLVPGGPGEEAPARRGDDGQPLETLLAGAEPAAGARLFRRCAACHTIGAGGADLNGPNLHGVMGAPVAGNRPRYGYTQALRQAGGVWTPARMDAWLRDPQGFAPGNRMAFPGLKDARERAELIAYLGGR